jgi:hypothetical protein
VLRDTMTSTEPTRTVEAIAELARWAPSGDNTQPWRFEILGPRHLLVHGQDTRSHCVYDLDGWASRLALGALVGTARIAAAAHGWSLQATLRAGRPDDLPTLDLRFADSPGGPVQLPVAAAIRRRSVQRRRYKTTALAGPHKNALQVSVGPGFEVRWLEGWAARARTARLMFQSARLRLTTPEAWRVHRSVIEWNARFSVDRIPDLALGVPAPMRALMRFALADWRRVQFLNRYLAGTWMPRLQMDLLPALACGAHFAIVHRGPPEGIEADLAAGEALQKFWLTATVLGLQLQPEQTPLIFSRYALQGRDFSELPGTKSAATQVGLDLASLLGPDIASRGVFLGRIGFGPAVDARSLRQPIESLMVDSSPQDRTGQGESDGLQVRPDRLEAAEP